MKLGELRLYMIIAKLHTQFHFIAFTEMLTIYYFRIG